MQKTVARVIHESSREDNIGETETLLQIEECTTQKNQFTQKRRRSGGDFSLTQEVEPTDEVMDLAVDPEPELGVTMAEQDERRNMTATDLTHWETTLVTDVSRSHHQLSTLV